MCLTSTRNEKKTWKIVAIGFWAILPKNLPGHWPGFARGCRSLRAARAGGSCGGRGAGWTYGSASPPSQMPSSREACCCVCRRLSPGCLARGRRRARPGCAFASRGCSLAPLPPTQWTITWSRFLRKYFLFFKFNLKLNLFVDLQGKWFMST